MCSCAVLVKISVFLILVSSLNVVVVFNLKVTHAAIFALKTTAAFNDEGFTLIDAFTTFFQR